MFERNEGIGHDSIFDGKPSGFSLLESVASQYPHMRPSITGTVFEPERTAAVPGSLELSGQQYLLGLIKSDVSGSGNRTNFLDILTADRIERQARAWARELAGKNTQAVTDVFTILQHLLQDPVHLPGVSMLFNSKVHLNGTDFPLYHLNPAESGTVMRRVYPHSRKWRPVFAVTNGIHADEESGSYKGVLAVFEFQIHDKFDRLRFYAAHKH